MEQLLADGTDFLISGGRLLRTAAVLLAPLLPLLAWITFWLFAVDWRKLRPVLASGGWLPLAVVAVGLTAVAVAASDEAAVRELGPLTVSAKAERIGWAAILVATMFYAGAAQISRGSQRGNVSLFRG